MLNLACHVLSPDFVIMHLKMVLSSNLPLVLQMNWSSLHAIYYFLHMQM